MPVLRTEMGESLGLTGQPAWPTGEFLASDEILSRTKQVAAPEEHHLKCSGLMMLVCIHTKEFVAKPGKFENLELEGWWMVNRTFVS